jgi:ribosomal subunit interface protein
MRITMVKGTNIPLTDAIKARIDSKAIALGKLTKDFDPAAELKVEVGKSTKHHSKGPYFRAEFQLNVPGSEMRSVTEETDLYQAIDKARDQVRRQLKDYKNKLKERTTKGVRPGKE